MFRDPFADCDLNAARAEADRRLVGLLAHGGEMERAMAKAIEAHNDQLD